LPNAGAAPAAATTATEGATGAKATTKLKRKAKA